MSVFDEPPRGLVNGKAPLLTAFLAKRAAMRERASHLESIFRFGAAPVQHVQEYNRLVEVLTGRCT